MTSLKTAAAMAGLALALAAGPAAQPSLAQPAPAKAPAQPPAGRYLLDPAHTSLTFRVSHMGLSHYTARFSRVDGALQFDPANPAAMRVEATIDPASLELNAPPAGFHDQMMGKPWFDAAGFPQITFRSIKVEPTGPKTARVTGDLTLRGISKPVTLEVTYNGGYAPTSFDPGGRVGFSAQGTLKRSDFGMTFGIPAPGSTMGVSDEVAFAIETEFSAKPAT